ncbi:hypothetical protein NDU88_007486 [Pleurodeles waltl]|uniref:Uncharacterized protein n=1 Tax=Pleurodeles waltl TaxID=8319 RepID=A0AAV7PQ40_PLEWA|nr:hypothetical protein NDU88_007486 [Pleurodeles waltl]
MGKWSQYKQCYRKDWESDPKLEKWIAPVQTDKTKALCKFCHVEIRAHYNNLKVHAETSKHLSRSMLSDESVTSSAVAVEPITDAQKRRELRIAAYAACNLQINALKDLADVLGDEFGAIRMHDTHCTAIVNSLLGPYFKEQLINDIGQSPYSLIVEQSTDILVKPPMYIHIRYFSQLHRKFVISFLGIIELPPAGNVAQVVLDFLAENHLQNKNLVGLAADKASVICSENHSVFISLKETLPSLQLVSCGCHSFENIAKKGVQSLPSNLEFMIMETYNCLQYLSKCKADGSELYRTLVGDSSLALVSQSGIHWLFMVDRVEKILEHYGTLKLHFCQELCVDQRFIGRLLQIMFNDETNFLYLTFLKPFLQDIKIANQVFLNKSGDLVEQFHHLQKLFVSTLERIVEPSVLANGEQLQSLDFQNLMLYRIQEQRDLGIEFQQKMDSSQLPADAKDEIAKRCFDFLRLLLMQYQMRLLELVNAVEKLEFLSPKKALADKKTVIELPGIFFTCPAEVLELQWTNLSSCHFREEESMERFWVEVYEYTDSDGNHSFQEIALGAFKMLLTLPVPYQHLEDVFSHLPFLKKDSLNRVGLNRLLNLLHIRFGLQRNGLTLSSFVPDGALLERFQINVVNS